MRRLFERLSPELERHGDLEVVTSLLGRLHTRGTGAARQRAAYARRGEMTDVIDELARLTHG